MPANLNGSAAETSPVIFTSSTAANRILTFTKGGSSGVSRLMMLEATSGLPAMTIDPVARTEMFNGPGLPVMWTFPPLLSPDGVQFDGTTEDEGRSYLS